MKKLTVEQRDEVLERVESLVDGGDAWIDFGDFRLWVNANTEQEEEETKAADFIKKFKELQESGVIKSVRRTGTYTGQEMSE